MSETTKLLSDEATRQEHLSDLLDWIDIRVNIYAREFKTHHAPDDKLELMIHENTVKLLKGYLDSFTKAIITDVEEPKVERAKLSDIDTRYNHLVAIMEMWRDAAEFIRDQYASKIVPPTSATNKIKMFRGAASIVEIYQESLAGQFAYVGVSRLYPAFKEGSVRVLKPWLDEAGKAGVAANKKRLLDAIDETAQSEKEKENEATKDDRIISDIESGKSSGHESDEGFSFT